MRPFLAAGSGPGERARRGRPTDGPDWHLPLPVRAPRVLREAIADRIAAGADVLLAPTWATHRRALAEVGEARRARAYTEAAVTLAREAAEVGLERRPLDRAPDLGDRPRVLVAGTVPALGEEAGTGRLAAPGVGRERDVAELVGVLADAGVDRLYLEPWPSLEASLAAADVAAAVEVPLWLELPEVDVAVASELAERLAAIGAEVVLRPPAGGRAPDGVVWRIAEGGASASAEPLPGDEALDELLAAEPAALALPTAADPERVGRLRDAIDRHVASRAARERAASDAWLRFVASGGERAPGGAGLWIVASADAAANGAPSGWAWATASVSDLGRLPEARFRLVAAADPSLRVDPGATLRSLAPGGVLVAAFPHTDPRAPGLQVLDERDDGALTWRVLRREGD